MSTTINNIGFSSDSDGALVNLRVGDQLSIIVKIQIPREDFDSWTMGQIKAAAIEAAKSKMPKE